MTGSEKRRHCAQCDKHVVALSEMTPEEADALVRQAKPHSLCLRIEHDDDGTILFRAGAPHATSNRATPLLTLVMGASLFAIACEHPAEPSATLDPAKNTSTESLEPTVSAIKDAPPLGDARDAQRAQAPIPNSVPQAEKRPAAADEKSLPDAHTRPAKLQNAGKSRITTGCVCAVGDRLCDCL